MEYPFDKDLLERLCVYGSALLTNNKAHILLNWKLITVGKEIADLTGEQTQLICLYTITDRGIEFCQIDERYHEELIQLWKKKDGT